MEWQNYNHLFYFWTIVKEGGATAAAAKLKLAQSTVSAQMALLEDSLGEKLFQKEGRKLTLTEVGQVVHRYADEIFSLGQEMRETLRGRPSGKSLRMTVGVTDSLPKLITHRLLRPAFAQFESLYLTCREDRLSRLLAELAIHQIDLVLSDAPLPSGLSIKAYNHLLGECGISFFALKQLKGFSAKDFPGCMNQAPFFLPGEESPLRKGLEQWFEDAKIYPRFVAEFEDRALLEVFAQSGKGIFAAPTVIERELQRQYPVKVIGRTRDILERFYAISAERKLKHPAVVAICDAARERLF